MYIGSGGGGGVTVTRGVDGVEGGRYGGGRVLGYKFPSGYVELGYVYVGEIGVVVGILGVEVL